MALHHAAAFGLRWSSDIPLHGFAAIAAGAVDVVVERTALPPERGEPRVAWSRGAVYADGFRFPAERIATFDCFDGRRLTWWPGPEWDGVFPRHMFGTVAALVLAWRGALPMHATAVEINGRAKLICGRSGAGKSTLAAGLVGLGARLISDDLTVVTRSDAGLVVHAGRPAIRLFDTTAGYLRDMLSVTPQPDEGGKVRAVLPATPLFEPVPVADVALLEPPTRALSVLQRAASLPQHMFRPRWMATLPGHRDRLTLLQRLAGTARLLVLPSEDVRDPATFWRRAETSLAELRGSPD